MTPTRVLAVAVSSLALLTTNLAWAGGPAPGDKAPAFSLKTVDKGETRTLESFTRAKGVKGAVVVFLSCKCPYVAQARAPLADLVKQYGSKIAFVGLNANQNEKVDDIKNDAALNFGFPMLRDDGSKVADLYAAERTPEIFVVDGAGVIRYHGGVADLGPALADVVGGKPVGKAESKAFGCTIKRKP
jgi:peroxiredoxin